MVHPIRWFGCVEYAGQGHYVQCVGLSWYSRCLEFPCSLVGLDLLSYPGWFPHECPAALTWTAPVWDFVLGVQDWDRFGVTKRAVLHNSLVCFPAALEVVGHPFDWFVEVAVTASVESQFGASQVRAICNSYSRTVEGCFVAHVQSLGEGEQVEERLPFGSVGEVGHFPPALLAVESFGYDHVQCHV